MDNSEIVFCVILSIFNVGAIFFQCSSNLRRFDDLCFITKLNLNSSRFYSLKINKSIDIFANQLMKNISLLVSCAIYSRVHHHDFKLRPALNKDFSVIYFEINISDKLYKLNFPVEYDINDIVKLVDNFYQEEIDRQ